MAKQREGTDSSVDLHKSFRDWHLTLTEEQVRAETARCLRCGVSVVDPNKCIGCGVCTTKCEFDAIRLRRENHLTRISSVTMQLGEVSGILEDYFADCWHWAQKRSDLLRDSELRLERIPAVTICNDCGRTYETVRHGRTCPFCGSDQTVLVTGNQCEIKEVEGC